MSKPNKNRTCDFVISRIVIHAAEIQFLKAHWIVEDLEVSFNNRSENYCVSFVDIVNSTSLVSAIRSPEKIRTFYSIFINAMANTLKKYNGRIIKNVGDGIISYFPLTKDTADLGAFEEVVQCFFAQINKSDEINFTLEKQGLPKITYRISADYGRVEVAMSAGSSTEDLFGSTVNYCAKINSQAPPNGIVVGNDLYRIIKSFSHFERDCIFEERSGCNLVVGKYSYPLYSLKRKSGSEAVPDLMENVKKQHFEAQKSTASRTNILLIDDERDDLYVLEKFLTLEGFEVKPFTSSRQALKHFEESNPSEYDLVVSDIRMPEINGFELYLRLKAVKSHVKIIFSTALEIADEILSLAPGLKHDQVIKKPIEQAVFVEIVRKNIRSSQ